MSRHQRILEYVHPGDSILDVGCVKHSLKEVNWRDPTPGEWLHAEICQKADDVLGIDLLEEDIKELKDSGLNVDVANAETFEFDQTFDLIIAGELIEHLSNPGLFFDRCYKHINDEGRVVITTPNPRRIQLLSWYATNNAGRVNPEHTMWFDQQVMRELASRHSFEIEEWCYYSPSLSILPRILFNFGLLKPLTSGGYVFILKPI